MIDLGPLYWEPVPPRPLDALRDARLQVHWALQVVAGFGQSCLPPEDDDHHRSTVWSESDDAFMASAPAPDSAWIVGLRPRDLTVLVAHLEDGVEEIPADGRTLDALHGAVEARLREVGALSGEGRLERPDWEMPGHPVGEGSGAVPFALGSGDAFAELAGWYRNAAGVLEHIRERFDGSTVRCWPHHFDIATLIEIDRDGDPKERRSVGVGFTGGDGGYEEPYWYANPWPYPDPERLPGMAASGHWHREGWVGAVLTRTELQGSGRPEDETLRGYLEFAIAAGLTLLGAEDRIE